MASSTITSGSFDVLEHEVTFVETSLWQLFETLGLYPISSVVERCYGGETMRVLVTGHVPPTIDAVAFYSTTVAPRLCDWSDEMDRRRRRRHEPVQ
jgi:hypothetical protein